MRHTRRARRLLLQGPGQRLVLLRREYQFGLAIARASGMASATADLAQLQQCRRDACGSRINALMAFASIRLNQHFPPELYLSEIAW